MKDISEFEKLFKVNFPVQEHHQYYIDTMMRSPFYAGIGIAVKEFEQYERDVEDFGHKNVKSYKLDYALPRLRDYLLNTEAYKNLMEWDIKENLRTKDELRNNDNTYLISIDFRSANYSSLKKFDSLGKLGDSWEGLCRDLDIHTTLSKSKSFRQYVFGNTSPKKLQKLQHSCIIKIVEKLIEDHGFVEEDFIFISHDEFIVRLQPDHKLSVNRIHLLNSEIGRIISEESINMPTHYNVFKLESLGKNKFIKTHYNVKMGGLSEKYTSLVGIPGNDFFRYFKEHILKEELDERDLYFTVDGKLAKWVV